MIEHRLNEDQTFMNFENQIAGLQIVQVKKEEEQEIQKEQEIQARQPQILDETKELNKAQEMIQKAFKNDMEGLELAKKYYEHFTMQKIDDGDTNYLPSELAENAIRETTRQLEMENKQSSLDYFKKSQEQEKDFQKWYENVNEIIKTNETNQIKFTPYTEEGEEEKFKNDINYAKKLYQREAKENNGDFIIMTNTTKDNVREVYNQYRKEYDEREQEHYYHYDKGISKERQKEIAQETCKNFNQKHKEIPFDKEEKIEKKLNPKEINELADETFKNINSNENFKKYYKLNEELEKEKKEQEELNKAYEEKRKKLYEEYGQGEYYKPNWTYYQGQKQEQNKEQEPQTQENERLKEFNEKLKLLELQHEKQMKELKDKESNIKKQIGEEVEKIIEFNDTQQLFQNLRNLDKLLISLNKNNEEAKNAPEKQYLEKIDLAKDQLRNDPELKEEIINKLKEQREKQKEAEKQKKEFDTSHDIANILSKKIDDMQNTNNLNAKQSFAEDVDKILKGIDKSKELEKQQKNGKNLSIEERKEINKMKMLEKHFGNTITRAKKEMEKYKQEKIQEKNKQKTQEEIRTL